MAAADTQELSNGAPRQNGEQVVAAPNTTGETNGEEIAAQDQADQLFTITVELPRQSGKVEIQHVGLQEQVQDLRTSIIESPDAWQYSCFHLEHNGERINEFVELSEVQGIGEGSVITLHEDPYSEREARVHMLRVKDLIGASSERIEPLYGLAAGSSLHDEVTADLPKEGDSKDQSAKLEQQAVAAETYDFTTSSSLRAVVPKKAEGAPKTIKSLTLSSFNPPPLNLRLIGHLMYLQFTSISGQCFFITSHVSGFWVNKCGNDKFDPAPKLDAKTNKPQFAHSLLTLIKTISPDFDGKMKQLVDFNHRRDPLNTFPITNALPAAPWVVSEKETIHSGDPSRNQETWLTAGTETSENLRDWNEEFQSTKELPKEQVQERVFRERVTNKLFADYTEAAVRGAMLVARGEVSPLNPTEHRDAQIFLHNNVFYSFGADGMGTFTTEGGDEAARVAVGKDVNGVRVVAQLDIDSLFTPGTVIVDYMGRRIVGQSIVPGIFKQREPGEHQIDYGGVEGRDIVTSNTAFVEPFSKLSKSLKIQKHDVWDKDGTRHTLEGSVETKGLLGTDGRKYVLDLYRLTPLDIIWLKENWTDVIEGDTKPKELNYPHRMTVVRQELVDLYWRHELSLYVTAEYEKRMAAKKDGKETQKEANEVSASEEQKEEDDQQERIDITKFELAFNPDVFSGQIPETEEDKEKWAADEKRVQELCKFLRENSIPTLLKELKDGDIGFPMDGQSLSRLLHKRGINIRYLGCITEQALTHVTETDKRLQALITLAVQEMITRSFKHIANRYMRTLPAPLVQVCIAHLLNCLLGSKLNQDPKAEIDPTLKEMYSDVDFSFTKVTPDSLRTEIEEQAYLRYRFTLGSDWQAKIKHVQVLRETALKLGLQLRYTDYQFSPSVNGSETNGTSVSKTKKKRDRQKKAALRESSSSESLAVQTPTQSPTTFTPEDIINIVPVVKDSTPKSNLAEEALEAGRLSLGQGKQELGQELLFEGMSLHEQVYGVLHPEVARVYHTLGMLYYQLNDHERACDLARKAAIVSERTLGLDSSETILSYLNLGLFEHAAGKSAVALGYLLHAFDLWKVAFGPIESHPDAITSLNNAAVMLQALKRYPGSRQWFEKSREVASNLHGASSVAVATLSFQLAQALALDKSPHDAVKMMREARNTFQKELGENDKNTKEADEWVKQLVTNSVNLEKHAKNVAAARAGRFGSRAGLVSSALAGRVARQVGESSDLATSKPRQADTRTPAEIARDIEGAGRPSKNSTPKKAAGKAPIRRK